MIKIALDAMGGDNAPHDVVHGGIEAARASKGNFEVVLVGDEERIKKEISRHFRTDELPISIVHASQVVEMDEQPSAALKYKKDSSISVAVKLHKQKEVDAIVSAGNTGAVMAASLFGLKRVKNIRRPALGQILPTETGGTLILDVGANMDSRPQDLVQFATMGSIYFSQLFSVEKPKVALLSVGHEDVKGNDVSLKTNQLLASTSLNFIGNVEGGDILKGRADVVVCDGFVGNIVIKFAESLHGLFKSSLRKLVRKYLFSQLGAVLMKPTFEGIRKIFDYQEYGGAPLLGVRGVVIIAHGRSTPRAIKNAILAATKLVRENFNEEIEKQVCDETVLTAVE